MKIALAVLPNGMVNSHLGRADKVAIATVENKEITNWEEYDVPFGKNHDHHHHDNHNHNHEHGHGQGNKHHESIRDFLVQHNVDVILVEHSGPGIMAMLEEANVKMVVVDIRNKAKDIVQNYINQVL